MSDWIISQNASESLVIDIHHTETSSDGFAGNGNHRILGFHFVKCERVISISQFLMADETWPSENVLNAPQGKTRGKHKWG
jgi:hypothetical protein